MAKLSPKEELRKIMGQIEQSAITIRRHQLNFNFKAPEIPEVVTPEHLRLAKQNLEVISHKANEYIQLEEAAKSSGRKAEDIRHPVSGLSIEQSGGSFRFVDEVRAEYTKEYTRLRALIDKIQQQGYTLPYDVIPQRAAYPTPEDVDELKKLGATNINKIAYRFDKDTGEYITRETDIYNKRVEQANKNLLGTGNKEKKVPKTHREKRDVTELDVPDFLKTKYIPQDYLDSETDEAPLFEADVIIENLIQLCKNALVEYINKEQFVWEDLCEEILDTLEELGSQIKSLGKTARRKVASFIIASQQNIQENIEVALYASDRPTAESGKYDFDVVISEILSIIASSGYETDFDSIEKKLLGVQEKLQSPEGKQAQEASQNTENEFYED